jgi:hypothetical protein
MKMIHGSFAVAGIGASLLSAQAASAQQPPPPGPVVMVVAAPPPPGMVVAEAPEPDGVRFRGGIALEGGALMPSGIALGAIGPRGELGVQINNFIGVYFVPGFDILFGPAGGLNLFAAALVDFTILDDRLTLGVGPDVGAFVAFGASGTSAAAAAGADKGARLHVGWNALITKSEHGARRKALTVGLDLRGLVGPEASATANVNGMSTSSGSSNGFVFSPMLSVGYTAF